MRIAIALFDDFPFGGLQRDARRFAEGLAARGHDVTLVSRSAEGPAPALVSRLLLPVARGSNHSRDNSFGQALAEQRHRFDFVVGCNKMPGLDVYFAADDCWANGRGRLSRLTPRGRARIAAERALFAPGQQTQILCLTARQRDSYMTTYGTELERFHLLPALLDSYLRVLPHNKAAKAVLGLPQDKPLALFVGRDARLKGLDRALAALPSELHLVAVTDERLGEGANVTYLPMTTGLSQAYAAADFLLHPARREAAGKVICEALYCGLPVITTDLCGYAPLVGRAGLVLPTPFDVNLLRAALQEATSPGRLAQWQRAIQPLPDNGQDAAIALIDGWARQGLPSAQAKDAAPPFATLWNLPGDVAREQPGRQTVMANWRGRRVAIKRHEGRSGREVIKNLVVGKRAVLGAENEWQALRRLQALGLRAPEPLLSLRQGKRSLLAMAAINVSTDLRGLLHRCSAAERQRLTVTLAQQVAALHRAGLAHRDLYLDHIYPQADDSLAILDWHRALSRSRLRRRWVVKDLAALLFSHGSGPRTRLLRFMAAYRGLTPRLTWERDQLLWQAVTRKAAAIAKHDHKLHAKGAATRDA